jgi:hypothetical protein
MFATLGLIALIAILVPLLAGTAAGFALIAVAFVGRKVERTEHTRSLAAAAA